MAEAFSELHSTVRSVLTGLPSTLISFTVVRSTLFSEVFLCPLLLPPLSFIVVTSNKSPVPLNLPWYLLHGRPKLTQWILKGYQTNMKELIVSSLKKDISSWLRNDSWPLNNVGLNCAGPLICGFFSIAKTTVLPNLKLVESADAVLQIWRNCLYELLATSFKWIFDCVEGWHP